MLPGPAAVSAQWRRSHVTVTVTCCSDTLPDQLSLKAPHPALAWRPADRRWKSAGADALALHRITPDYRVG